MRGQPVGRGGRFAFHRLGVVTLNTLTLVLFALVAPSAALAQGAASVSVVADAEAPGRNECIQAHLKTQKEQYQGQLLSALSHARVCTHSTCPGVIVADCASWLEELEPRIPSLVFEVRLDGTLNEAARIEVDGEPVVEWTQGQALQVNPGQHEVRFFLEGHEPIARMIPVAEGMRFRLVAANFAAPTAPVAQPENRGAPFADREAVVRPVPVMVYPLAGLGVAAMGSFIAFTLSANAEYDRLERACAPLCTDDDVSTARRRYLLGDISLGASALSLAGAAALYFGRPTVAEPRPTLGFVPLRSGGMATVEVHTY